MMRASWLPSAEHVIAAELLSHHEPLSSVHPAVIDWPTASRNADTERVFCELDGSTVTRGATPLSAGRLQ